MSALFKKNDNSRNTDLTSKQDMLTSLRHRTVSRRNDQNRTVHLRRTGDHVLNVVGVSRAIDVSVVALVGFVLDMGDVDRNATLSFFRSLIYLVISQECALALISPALW